MGTGVLTCILWYPEYYVNWVALTSFINKHRIGIQVFPYTILDRIPGDARVDLVLSPLPHSPPSLSPIRHTFCAFLVTKYCDQNANLSCISSFCTNNERYGLWVAHFFSISPDFVRGYRGWPPFKGSNWTDLDLESLQHKSWTLLSTNLTRDSMYTPDKSSGVAITNMSLISRSLP